MSPCFVLRKPTHPNTDLISMNCSLSRLQSSSTLSLLTPRLWISSVKSAGPDSIKCVDRGFLVSFQQLQ